MTFKNQLALIIPTRNRPETLIKLLKTIKNQTVPPHQVIIVDGSDIPIESQIKKHLNLSDKYIHVLNPSLTKQKNEGIKQLQEGITLAGFLDDDIELEESAVREMLRFWEDTPPNTGGVSFNIINTGELNRFSKLIRRIFCIHNGTRGRVLPSGCCTGAVPATSDVYCQWLCGGATVWKREVLEKYKFDEWYSGWACYEDVEYSYRVLKDHHDLYVAHKAGVTHNPPPVLNAKNAAFGKMLVINRYHFVKKNPNLSIMCFYWATLGDIILNVLKSVWERNFDGIRIAQGNLSGIYYILSGNPVRVDECFRK
jgi:glycosyltransferase involved in cell wall biosynthesis